MAAPIEFYFDFSSPYGYLASQKIEALAAKHGRTVDWQPMLLGVVFKQTGMAPLTRFRSRATTRGATSRAARASTASRFRMPSKFPIPTQAPARIVLWLKARDPALAVRVAKALYRAYFVDDIDISTPERGRRRRGEGGRRRGGRARGHRRSGDQGRAEARGRRGDRRAACSARRSSSSTASRSGGSIASTRSSAGSRPAGSDTGGIRMAEYTLYCFAQSGNAYKPALMLELAGADWAPRFVDYFNGETRTPAYRAINVMGEVPVLEHRGSALSQSGVILDYLAETLGKFGPARRRRAARDPALAPVRQPQADELHGDLSIHAHVRQGSGSRGAGRIPQARGNRMGRARRASRRARVTSSPTG